MDTNEQINTFKEFIEKNYITKLRKPDIKFVEIDFKKLAEFDPDIANILLDEPEETIKAVELAIESLDFKDIQVLFKNLPKSTEVPLNEVSDQLNKFLTFEGYVMKPSDIFLKAKSGRFECKSCFPKGTLVLTPKGNKPIEKANTVISMDKQFKPIVTNSKIIKVGKKQIWEINNEIKCSGEHQWFVYRNGTIKVIQTKHLNTSDILIAIDEKENFKKKFRYNPNNKRLSKWKFNIQNSPTIKCETPNNTKKIKTKWNKNQNNYREKKRIQKEDAYGKNLYNLWQKIYSRILLQQRRKINSQEEINLFSKMQKPILFKIPNRGRKNENRQSKSNRIIQKRIFYDKNSRFVEYQSQLGKKKIIEIWHKIKNKFRTNKNRDKIPKETLEISERQSKSILQAWKTMWIKEKQYILQGISKERENNEMRGMWFHRFIKSSSQRFKSFQQQIRKPSDSLSILPFKVTLVNKTKKEVEMYDLQVPDYHNFILSNGIITHNCGNILTTLMLGKNWVSPKNCGCGSKQFRLLDKKLIKFQRLEIQEAIDYVPDKPRKLIKKKVFISENLTRKDLNQELQPGQRVKIAGFLELEELNSKSKKRSNEFRVNIIANNIIPIKTSWEAIHLKSNQKRKIKEMAKKKNLLDEFAQSLAPTFEGYNLVRKSLILQHVGGKRLFDENGNLDERGIIHILMVSDPSKGKTFLLRRSVGLSPLWIWAQGASLTKAGLVASITKDEYGSPTLEIGPLVMADGGILALEELDKVNKSDFGVLNNAMAEEQTKITKWNIDQTLRTRTSILSTANPLHRKFIDEESIIKQLAPIPKDILDRFDIIWAMREEIDEDKLEEKYMARHLKSGAVNQTWTNDEMRYYIAYARNLIPIIDNKSAKYFGNQFKKLTGKTGEDKKSKSERLRGNLLRLTYAHSKFISVGKENKDNEIGVTKESIDFAFKLMKHSFDMLGLLNKEGFTKYEDLEEIPTKKEINKYYLIKGMIKELANEYGNAVPENKLLEKAQKENSDITMEELDRELTKLSRAGEIFQPKPTYWSLL